MHEVKHLVVPLIEVKAEPDANGQAGIFEGYGSVFGNIDLGGDVVERGAFKDSLNRWSSKGEMPAMFGYHKFDNPVGDWLEMSEDDRGLKGRGRLWVYGDTRIEEAVKCYNVVKGTGPKGLSIGYRTIDEEVRQTERGSVRMLKELDLLEVSVVGFAMNPEASVTNVKSFVGNDGQIASKREVERILRDAGLSDRKAKAFIAGGYNAMMDRDDSEDMSDILASLDQLLTIAKGAK